MLRTLSCRTYSHSCQPSAGETPKQVGWNKDQSCSAAKSAVRVEVQLLHGAEDLALRLLRHGPPDWPQTQTACRRSVQLSVVVTAQQPECKERRPEGFSPCLMVSGPLTKPIGLCFHMIYKHEAG